MDTTFYYNIYVGPSTMLPLANMAKKSIPVQDYVTASKRNESFHGDSNEDQHFSLAPSRVIYSRSRHVVGIVLPFELFSFFLFWVLHVIFCPWHKS